MDKFPESWKYKITGKEKRTEGTWKNRRKDEEIEKSHPQRRRYQKALYTEKEKLWEKEKKEAKRQRRDKTNIFGNTKPLILFLLHFI